MTIEESNTQALRDELSSIYDRVRAILVELEEMKARVSDIASMGPAQSAPPLTYRLVLPVSVVMDLDEAANRIESARKALEDNLAAH